MNSYDEIKKVERLEAHVEKIAKQLKLIPNNFPISGNDLKEIFSQDERTTIRSMAREGPKN